MTRSRNTWIATRHTTLTSKNNFKQLRDVNGQSLVDYCDSNGLYLTNTTFQHAARHKTTWTGWRRDMASGNTVPIFNQIDYIVCRSSNKRMLQNCRSYGGMEISTDHKLVVADLDLARIYGVLGAYVCVCVCARVSASTHVCVCVRARAWTHMCVCMHVSRHVYSCNSKTNNDGLHLTMSQLLPFEKRLICLIIPWASNLSCNNTSLYFASTY